MLILIITLLIFILLLKLPSNAPSCAEFVTFVGCPGVVGGGVEWGVPLDLTGLANFVALR